MSNVPLKDLKYSRFYVRSVYFSWKDLSHLIQNGCKIVRATVTLEFSLPAIFLVSLLLLQSNNNIVPYFHVLF